MSFQKISEIQIENFESHPRTKIKFVDGFNVIRGETDSGKSGVLRAIKECLLRSESGWSFRPTHLRAAKTKTRIVVKTPKNTIFRIKTQNLNGYAIDEESNLLSALKTSLLAEVKEILPVSEVNFHNQEDSPFMLSSSSGKVARMLDGVVGLSAVETITKTVDSTVRELNAESKVLLKDAKELEKKTASKEWMIPTIKDTQKLKEKSQIAQNILNKIESLKKITDEIKRNRYNLDELPNIEIAKILIESTKEKQERSKSLSKNLSEFQSIVSAVNEYQNKLASLSQNNDTIKRLIDKIDKHSDINEKIQSIVAIIKIIEETKHNIATAEFNILEMKESISKETQSKEYCETCGSHKDHWRT